MAKEMVRVVLVPEVGEESERGDRQIWVDMLRDDETGISSGPFPAFGRIGDFRKAETLVPFTLMMDGRMDTGVHAENAKRQDVLHLRTAPLAQGQGVALVSPDGSSANYLIDRVTPLVG